MKYIECKSKKYSILNNTTNCVPNSYYNDYYIKKFDDNITVLNPCSELDNTCYECDPTLESEFYGELKIGICLSCNPGYEYIEFFHWCIKHSNLKIIINDFENCERKENDTFHFQYCNKYITTINLDLINLDESFSQEFICPDEAPIFNYYLKSCVEMDCPEEGFSNGKCIIYKQKYIYKKNIN
jgi:hypothetical protein